MSMMTIAIQYKYTCNSCGKEHMSATKDLPPHWDHLHLSRRAYDFSDAAVADASINLDLCQDCSKLICEAINAECVRIRSV